MTYPRMPLHGGVERERVPVIGGEDRGVLGFIGSIEDRSRLLDEVGPIEKGADFDAAGDVRGALLL
jgi:hypothetical protein